MTKLMAETNEAREDDILVKLMVRNYQGYGDTRIALRRKNRGMWEKYSWKDYYENAKGLSLGLISLGLKAGDKISVMGDNQPEWLWAALAAHATRAVVVGIFPDCTPPEVKYYVDHSDSTFIIAEDQEQVDKILEIRDEVPKIKKLIYWDREGMYGYKDPFIMYFYDVVKLGMEYEKTHPGLFEHNIQEVKLDDIAAICYTSGTTGLPKGATVSHGLLQLLGAAWAPRDPWQSEDRYLSYLNPAWSTEWQFGYTYGLKHGAVIYFAEEADTMQADLREVGPQIIFYGSRMWESLASTVQAKISDTHHLCRFMYNLFIPIGYKVCDASLSGGKLNLVWRLLYRLGDWLLFRPLRDKLGMVRIRWGYTGGAGLSPDIIRFFQAIGVNVKQLYGTTEVANVSAHIDGQVKPETVGSIFADRHVRISDNQEILIKLVDEHCSYYKDPEAYEEQIERKSWFKTGDAGYIDEDGQLVYIDRVKSLMELAGGQKFPPDFIETRLRFSPYIKDAISIGGKHYPYVTALIVIDFDNVAKWAERNKLTYTTFSDLSQRPQVYDLVFKEVERVNKLLPEWSRIEKYALLHKEFDPDEAELTRTRKLRRGSTEEKYLDVIKAMYTDSREAQIESPVIYRDGRRGLVKTTISIRYVKEKVVA